MKKITPWALNFLLAGSLDETFIFDDLISKISFLTDEDGNIPDFQVDNIKTTLKVALRMTVMKNDAISGKIRNALTFLLDYGTKKSSQNIKTFLASPESQSPLVITKLEDDLHQKIGESILPFLSGADGAQKQKALDDIRIVLTRCVQNFN